MIWAMIILGNSWSIFYTLNVINNIKNITNDDIFMIIFCLKIFIILFKIKIKFLFNYYIKNKKILQVN